MLAYIVPCKHTQVNMYTVQSCIHVQDKLMSRLQGCSYKARECYCGVSYVLVHNYSNHGHVGCVLATLL